MTNTFENFMTKYANLKHTDKDKFNNYRIIVDRFYGDELMFGGEVLDYVREVCFLSSTLKEDDFKNIQKAFGFHFVNCVLPSTLSLNNTLFVQNTGRLGVVHNDSLFIERCNDLKNVSNIFGDDLKVFITNCNSFENYNVTFTNDLRISNCYSFNKMSCITSRHVKRCSLSDVHIIDKCDTSFNVLTFTHCDYLKSFTDIQNLHVLDNLILENITENNSQNLINVLMTKSKNICLTPNMTGLRNMLEREKVFRLLEIILKYFKKKNPSEHVMDCAMELLDDNFDMAAEL